MSDEFHAAKAGEVRVAAPAPDDARLRFIGRIRTPWSDRAECPKNSREAMARGDKAICAIEIDPLWRDGLLGLDRFSHVWALYWMDRAARDLSVQAPRHLDGTRGVFALRSPARPNPVAMAAARILGIDGLRIRVLGLDCLDGTPLIDLKPYYPSTDGIADAVTG